VPAQDDRFVLVAQMDDSLRVADDCQADSVVDDCQVDSAPDDWVASADCPAEADSPQDCSCPDARSRGDFLLVDLLADFRAEHWAECRDDFRRPEVAAAWPAEL
jgi:hypothetical protein